MKSKLFVFITLFCCSIAHADLIDKHTKVLEEGMYYPEPIATSDPELKNQICSAVFSFAENSFKARQNGASAEEMFSVINEKDEPSVKKAMQSIIVDSFKYPIMYSGDGLISAASDYANRFYIDCMN
ncbi:hypothetical protein G0029_06690 [Acinetobacter sp. YH12138]|uniref:hypothetical protein n=1 Tax=Acinetobacter sp. YH12138 TaxID=2601122 RepID=UPI0015D3966B|nr:hypothetical protein [Acinetobacter sp. YH12138]QOW49507.1 hypothetical protein G0029_06690 [Acinetobacter sp. YH12138]